MNCTLWHCSLVGMKEAPTASLRPILSWINLGTTACYARMDEKHGIERTSLLRSNTPQDGICDTITKPRLRRLRRLSVGWHLQSRSIFYTIWPLASLTLHSVPSGTSRVRLRCIYPGCSYWLTTSRISSLHLRHFPEILPIRIPLETAKSEASSRA